MRLSVLLATAGVTTAGLVVTGHALTGHEKFIETSAQDVGNKGPTMGDGFGFVSEIRDLERAKLGIAAGECVLLPPGSGPDTFRFGS
jgi:hypothetical protein